jgi:hypothetical protein
MSHEEAMMVEIAWIKSTLSKSIKWLITIIIASAAAISGGIYVAGAHVQDLESHKEADILQHREVDKDLLELKTLIKDIADLKILEALGSTGAKEQLEELRKDWEKKQPPIYAVHDGEEA